VVLRVRTLKRTAGEAGATPLGGRSSTASVDDFPVRQARNRALSVRGQMGCSFCPVLPRWRLSKRMAIDSEGVSPVIKLLFDCIDLFIFPSQEFHEERMSSHTIEVTPIHEYSPSITIGHPREHNPAH